MCPNADIRVSDLIEGAVRLEWYEAVALVLTAGMAVLADGADTRIPGPDRMWLSQDGTLLMTAVTSGEPLVPGMASLLAALLPASAPAELRLLDSSNPAVLTASSEDYFKALTFFARGDHEVELRSVFERATSGRHVSTVAAAAPSRRPMLPSRRRVLTIAVVLTTLAVIVTGHWSMTKTPPRARTPDRSGPVVIRDTAKRVHAVMASVREVVWSSLSPPMDEGVRRSADIQLGRRLPHEPTDTRPVASEANLKEVDRLPDRPRPPATTVAAPVGSRRPYAAGDAGVAAPSLLRAQMPEVQPGELPDVRRGVLDLLISESGRVVAARLVTPAARRQEQVMLSAAKTWRFSPALRHGKPVRYRLSMPITW